MNRKIMTALTLAMTFAVGAFASGTGKDRSETGVPTSPLKIHSVGVGLAAIMAGSEDFERDCGASFLGVSLNHTWRFRENVALFADFNWYAGNDARNFGVDLGADYLFSTSSFRPFVGAGIGGQYFFREGADEFGDRFGPSVTAHIGMSFDVTETVSIRVRAPYRYVRNTTRDQSFGVDASLMFTSKFKKVRQLHY